MKVEVPSWGLPGSVLFRASPQCDLSFLGSILAATVERGSLLSALLGVHSEVELLVHVVILFDFFFFF